MGMKSTGSGASRWFPARRRAEGARGRVMLTGDVSAWRVSYGNP